MGRRWPARMRGAIMPCLIFWLPFLSRKKVKTITHCQQAHLSLLSSTQHSKQLKQCQNYLVENAFGLYRISYLFLFRAERPIRAHLSAVRKCVIYEASSIFVQVCKMSDKSK